MFQPTLFPMDGMRSMPHAPGPRSKLQAKGSFLDGGGVDVGACVVVVIGAISTSSTAKSPP